MDSGYEVDGIPPRNSFPREVYESTLLEYDINQNRSFMAYHSFRIPNVSPHTTIYKLVTEGTPYVPPLGLTISTG